MGTPNVQGKQCEERQKQVTMTCNRAFGTGQGPGTSSFCADLDGQGRHSHVG